MKEVPFINRRYTRGVPFLWKMVYKRVRGWNPLRQTGVRTEIYRAKPLPCVWTTCSVPCCCCYIAPYITFHANTKSCPVCCSYSLAGANLGGGCRGCAPPPPPGMTCGFLIQVVKKTMWFIIVEVEQETSAPPPEKNPGSAPASEWLLLFAANHHINNALFRLPCNLVASSISTFKFGVSSTKF